MSVEGVCFAVILAVSFSMIAAGIVAALQPLTINWGKREARPARTLLGGLPYGEAGEYSVCSPATFAARTFPDVIVNLAHQPIERLRFSISRLHKIDSKLLLQFFQGRIELGFLFFTEGRRTCTAATTCSLKVSAAAISN